MTHYENPVRLVKELKGAPLAILVLLSFSPVAVSREWLEVYSGYSDKPVSKALYYLQENGFIVKTAAGWRIAEGGQQLPLPLSQDPDTLPGGEFSAPGEVSTPVENRNFSENPDSDSCRSVDNGYLVDNLDESVDNSSADEVREVEKIGEFPKNRKNSDSPLISINLESSTHRESNLKLTNGGENRRNSESPSDSPPSASSGQAQGGSDYALDGEERLVASCLAEHGILLNRRTRRLLGRISVDDVWAVVGDLREQGKQGETGLMVVRLEQRAALGVSRPVSRSDCTDFRRYGSSGMDGGMDPPEVDMDPGDPVGDWDIED